MIEVSCVASTNPTHSRCKKRRPALKKNTTTTSSARSKKTRQTVSTKTTPTRTVGIDLGDQNSAYCVLDAQGDVMLRPIAAAVGRALRIRLPRVPRQFHTSLE